MVKVKSAYLDKSPRKIKKLGWVIGSTLLMSTFISCGDNVEYVTEEVMTPTQGIVTEVKEMEKDLFKITDEQVVATPADSRIVAEYMDGVRDTFTLEEARLVDAENSTRRSSMNSVLMGGMIGYMMGKSMSTPVSSAAYANNAAYQKSTAQTNNQLRSTASRKTVRKPKSGFGSSKSSRSYGG
ncbi:MAG: hypothetical protein AAGD05_06010 [Bacteroidota bacterium]